MQMVSSEHYETLSKQNQTRTVTTPAPRGRILDRNGVELVTNRPSLAVGGYRDLANDPVAVRHLANVLACPTPRCAAISSTTTKAPRAFISSSDVRLSTVAHIQEHASEFPDVHIEERTERVYPHGTLASHVLGYTGTVTSEQLQAQSERSSNGESSAGDIVYKSGDIVGQSGVELMYENLLQGIRGEQTVRVDSGGDVLELEGSVPPRAGSDIKLTLDIKIQKACEGFLGRRWRSVSAKATRPTRGRCICMDCRNGEILGIASEPTFDPSVFIGGVSNDNSPSSTARMAARL